MKREFEAVVVGLGPAGIAAATILAENGIQTAVIDEQALPGGQIYRQLPDQFHLIAPTGKKIKSLKAKQLIARLNRVRDRITFFDQTTVYGFFNNAEISLFKHDHHLDIAFQKLILCEGALERIVPFPGWTLPGVMTAGGLQRFVEQQGLLPGRRVLLTGTGPLQLSVAASLVTSGAKWVSLCEAAPFSDSIRFVPEILRHRTILGEAIANTIPFLSGKLILRQPYGIVGAYGDRRVNKAIIARLNRNGSPIPGTEKELAVDIIAVHHGFLPQTRLTRLAGCRHHFVDDRGYWEPVTDDYRRTSRKRLYIAGDGAGIGGAHSAALQGQIAAWHVSAQLGKVDSTGMNRHLKPLLTATARWRRYADALFRSYRLRRGLFDSIDRQTIICRCEGVTAGRIWDAIDSGVNDLTALKPTRFAMGPCQGRFCEPIVSEMMCQQGFHPASQGQLSLRPPVYPLPITALANKI